MKKLLLLINITIWWVVIVSCQNTKLDNINNISNIVAQDKIIEKDTTNNKIKTKVFGIIGKDKGMLKATTKRNKIKGKAIIHNAPGQTKIDSIKNAKLKNKY